MDSLKATALLSVLFTQTSHAVFFLSPASSEGLSAAYQYTVTFASAQTLTSLVANFYTNSECSGTPNGSVTMDGGGSALSARAYHSSNTSNYALCQAYPGGCTAAHANGSVQFVYTFSWGTFTGSCIAAKLQNASGAACTSNSDCGFSATASDNLNSSGKLFISITSSNGSFNASAANAICASEASTAGLPGTYTALFVSTVPSTWSVMPSVSYFNAYDNTLVTSTNGAGIFGVLVHDITQIDGGAARLFWTGYGGVDTCSNWSDRTAFSQGVLGFYQSGISNWYEYSSNLCSAFNNFLCVSYNG